MIVARATELSPFEFERLGLSLPGTSYAVLPFDHLMSQTGRHDPHVGCDACGRERGSTDSMVFLNQYHAVQQPPGVTIHDHWSKPSELLESRYCEIRARATLRPDPDAYGHLTRDACPRVRACYAISPHLSWGDVAVLADDIDHDVRRLLWSRADCPHGHPLGLEFGERP